jgi:hypothetical protein
LSILETIPCVEESLKGASSMSYHSPSLSRSAANHPIVLRFAEMRPEDLAKFVMHLERAGGDLSHVDLAAVRPNERLIGEKNWAELAMAEVNFMRHANFAEELGALKKLKRRKEMDARIFEGLTDPWRESKGGPLREVILTANKDWFEDVTQIGAVFDIDERAEREAQFKAHAVEWLQTRFGEAVIHAHADHDETTCHIHAIIMPRHEKTSGRRGLQRLLQPSSHPLLKNYEAAQDDAGAFFGKIGLKRGARGAAARRLVLEANREARKVAKETGAKPVLQGVPTMREHVPTPVWYAQEVRRLKDLAEVLVARDAEVVEKQTRADAAKAEAQASNDIAKRREEALERREEDVVAREREVEDVVVIAQAVSSGQIEFDHSGEDVQPVMRPPETEEEEAIQARLKRSTPRTKSFYQSLQRTYARMRSNADQKAAEKLTSEVASVKAVTAAIETFKASVLKRVPEKIRNRLLRDILSIQRAERKMDESLEKPVSEKKFQKKLIKTIAYKVGGKIIFIFSKVPCSGYDQT